MKVIFSNFVLIVLFTCNAMASDMFSTLQVDFTRSIVQNGIEEKTGGKIYYLSSNRTLVEVTTPLHQWMILEGNSLYIYYPESRDGFKIKSASPTSLPFFQAFMAVVQENHGLTDAGFTLESNEVKGDTLYSYWNPPESAKKVIQHAVVCMLNDKVINISVLDTKSRTISSTTYSEHIPYKNHYFPLNIESQQARGANADDYIQEIVKYD